jgi:predicted outer membrane lipoprotein
MNVAQATSIINAIAVEHDTGILETLGYMQGIYNSSHAEWREHFDQDERKAYWIVVEGMRELFFGVEPELEDA